MSVRDNSCDVHGRHSIIYLFFCNEWIKCLTYFLAHTKVLSICWWMILPCFKTVVSTAGNMCFGKKASLDWKRCRERQCFSKVGYQPVSTNQTDEGSPIWRGDRDIQIRPKFTDCLFIFCIILTMFHYYIKIRSDIREVKCLTKSHTARWWDTLDSKFNALFTSTQKLSWCRKTLRLWIN